MNILIKDASVLSMEGDNAIQNRTNIGIEGERIRFTGSITEGFTAEKVIDGSGKLVMPGLVNAHTHAAMSLLRNYADDIPFEVWLKEKMWPLEAKLTEEQIYWGSMLSIAEMLRSGITCFADMYFFVDQTARAVEESGIRACLARGLMEDESSRLKLDETRRLVNDWNNKGEGRISIMAGPHAPYTCGNDYLRDIIELSGQLDIGIHIHLSESMEEVKDSYRLFGISPIERMKKIGLFKRPTLAAHCVHLSDEDIGILAENHVSVANNPGSNLKLGNGFAPVGKLLQAGVNVALGTDGAASNNNLNMFEEINLAALVNKGINHDTTSVPAYAALQMAIIGGAQALGLEGQTGTISPGKKADMIILDMKKPHLYPGYNLISSLAYSAQASDVTTVIVNGKVLMESGELKTIDLEKVMHQAESCAEALMA